MPLDDAPTVTHEVATPEADPSNMLKFLNPDINNDTLTSYLNGQSGFMDLIETTNGAVEPGAVEPGAIATLPQMIRQLDRNILIHAEAIQLRATKVNLSSELILLSDLLGMSLESPGVTYRPGMVITWADEEHTRSLVRFQTDTLQVGNYDEELGYQPVFVVGTIDGAPSVGINGGLYVDGSIMARHIAVDQLVVGENVTMGTGAIITWENLGDTARENLKGETGAQGIQGATGAQGIQGPTGAQGIQGPTGATGQNQYFHIAYATAADGTGFSQSPTGKTYIGTYVDFSGADSNTPGDYSWQLFKGADGLGGDQGIPGENGADGITYYLHVAYATAADGSAGFSTTVTTGKTYIGTLVDTTATDSETYTNYSWVKFEGPQGPTGADGADTFMPENIQESGGGLLLLANGFIRSADKNTDGTGTGILYGVLDDETPVFNVGGGAHGSTTPHISWNGAELEIKGTAIIDTLEIADEAVTVMSATEFDVTVISSYGTWTEVVSTAVDFGAVAPSKVLLSVIINGTTGEQAQYFRFYRDTTLLLEIGTMGQPIFSTIDEAAPACECSYTVKMMSADSSWAIPDGVFLIQGAKR
jgi:hypothetical protein